MDYRDEDRHTCRVCHGRKVIPGSFTIRDVCPNCNGIGEIDWVCNAMGGEGRNPHPDHQFLYNIAQRNIQEMIQEIKRQGGMLGMVVNIEVHFEREPSFEQMYLTNPRPMLFPKNTKFPE